MRWWKVSFGAKEGFRAGLEVDIRCSRKGKRARGDSRASVSANKETREGAGHEEWMIADTGGDEAVASETKVVTTAVIKLKGGPFRLRYIGG